MGVAAQKVNQNLPNSGLSRFFPRYKVDDLPPTPAETIYRLKDIAEKKLKYVYTGNL